MKKIYMILAAISLLSLSLNAQMQTVDHSNNQLHNVKVKGVQAHHNNNSTNNKYSFINLLRSTKGMSTIMPQIYDGTPVQGLLRAPLRLNSDEVTVGPFTGDNFDNGLGFGNAYSSPQEIFIETDLLRSEYADYIGEDIIGFRLALAGDATNTVQVGEFMAWPGNSDGSFDQDHLYTWSIGELTNPAGQPYDQYVRINSTSDLESGAEYLIVYETDNVAFNGGLTSLDVGNNVISVTRNNDVIQSNATTDAATFTITQSGNYYTIRSKSGYYIGRTSSSNGMNTNANTVYNNSITFTGNNATIRGRSSTSNNATNTYYLRFLNTSGNNNYRFRYYPTSTGQNIQLYKKVTVTPTAPAYVALQDGQWHEFYLDNPVPFVVGSDNTSLSLGYTYIQYPTGTSGENLFPIAVNSQSTTHNHYAYLTVESQGGGSVGDITISCENCFQTSFYYIIVVDNATGDYLTYWAYNGATYTNGNGQTCWELPNGWSLDGAAYFYQETVSGYNLGYLSTNGPASIVISSSAFGGNSNVSVLIAAAGWADGYTVSVNGDAKTIESGTIADYEWNPVNFSGGGGTTTNTGWYQQDFSNYGDLAVQLIFKSKLPKTDPPVITADTTATAVNITATATDPTATVTMTIDGVTYNGTGSVTATFPRGNSDSSVNVSATALEDEHMVSDPATATIGIPALPITPTPVITYEVTENSVIITATGQGTVNLSAGGQTASGEGTAVITIPRGADDQTVTATATAQLPNYQPSAQAQETITIPEAGRSPQPNITFTDNGDGSYTITVTGTGEVAVYIDDADHAGAPIATADGTFSFNVEQHSQAMSITVTATNQEEGLAVSHPKTETYNIPAMTIDSDFKPLDPQPANGSAPIDMSKLMFVDRFSVVIPHQNNHPWMYDYYLQETQVRQRTSNSVEVPVKHTGSDGLGYYTLTQIDNDIDRKLKMDVRNAAIDIPLEADPGIYFYTAERSTAAYPDQADRKYLGVFQRTSDGNYYETLNPSYDYDSLYIGGQHHIHLDPDTIVGEYNQYLTYVPVVWTMGFDRVLYPTDHVHNSYGAPKWRTGVADVIVNAVDAEKQINSASTTWNDNGKTNMYMLTVDATGFMPTVNTMPYEPYMFRVFVESQNGKLRGWKYVEADPANNVGSHYEAADGTTTGPICVWSEYVKNSPYITQNGNEVYFVKTKVEERDSVTNQWIVPRDMNIMFAALDDLTTETHDGVEYVIEGDLKIYVRFYYIVEGKADGHNPVVPTRDGAGEAPAGYGSESPGTPPSPSTGVKEINYYGDVVSTTYYNVQGISSTTPFNGINIVVTRYSNGTTRTTKVVR